MKTAAAISPEKPESVLGDVMTLVKARLSLLVLITTLVGFFLGWRGPMDWTRLVATLVGTALCAGGAAAGGACGAAARGQRQRQSTCGSRRGRYRHI